MKLITITLLILLSSMCSAQFFPFSIGGQGLASSLGQCPAPALNFAYMCPVAGQGWFYTLNGTPYASWQGPAGPAATIAIGTVSSGTVPAVTNSGSAQNAVLNFVLQPGQPGVVQVGGTLTLDITCPKGRGNVQAGWGTLGCTAIVRAYSPPQ